MITIFNCTKNTENLTPLERKELFKYIDAYKDTQEGEWLKQVTYRSVTYKWGKDLIGTDVMGIRPITLCDDVIVLQPSANPNDFWVQLMASTAIHELRHIYQQMKYGLLVYSIMSIPSKIPFLYHVSPLERDAFTEQDKAHKLIMKMQ